MANSKPPVTPPASTPDSSDVYGVFVDDINQGTASRIVNGITSAIAARSKHIHVMFQSWGGFAGDGVMLYNFFRSLSVIDLTLYNSGQLCSGAVTAYLGAKHRVASPRSIFMIHKSHNSPQFATAAKMDRVAKCLALDDERSESIWRDHVKMPEELWQQEQHHDLHLTGGQALEFGIATELGEFAPPPGAQIYRV